ncbi:MAG TPA: helix-turn-helix domain-containing protein [Chloroflexia bacterium]|nr:helix-turn-helix domain-containing protein [Chloroflexia bacterium]
MRKQDQINLETAQHEQLNQIVRKGEHKAREIQHAHLLLKMAAGWTDARLAETFSVSTRTVKRVRRRFLEEGLEAAVFDKVRSGRPVEYAGADQALIIATACTPAPQGAEHWTLQLLTERVIELGVEGISRETVRRTLKKTNSNLTSKGSGA